MARIVRRPRARQDLIEIWRYVADDSGEPRADRYLRRLNDVISYLAQQPLMGRKRPEIPEQGIRSFAAESHVVFYMALEDGIELVRVIHGSQDLERAWTAENDRGTH
ncbi:MAG: type II toxin-antitoxin system RelE/ParE family toxin [Steroidobacteraceae bacterium]